MARDWSQQEMPVEKEPPKLGRMIFTAEYQKQSVRVEIPGDSNLSDTLDSIEAFLIASGFDAEQVKKSFSE